MITFDTTISKDARLYLMILTILKLILTSQSRSRRKNWMQQRMML